MEIINPNLYLFLNFGYFPFLWPKKMAAAEN